MKTLYFVGTALDDMKECRIRNASGIYRVFYVANVGNAVYVLHAFNKKTEATAKADIDLARKRLGELG